MKETMSSSISHVLISLFVFVLMHEHVLAIKQSYIVYLGSHSFGPNPSLLDFEAATNSHYDLLGSYLGSTEKAKESIFYSYNKNINGFAAILDENVAAELGKHSNVISIFLNRKYELHTTRSWEFLGLERGGQFPIDSLWNKSLGEDIIIGNLDSGVWPESKSFSDEGYGPIPKKWRGICQVSEGNKDNFHCNRKLIGARYFYKGYESTPGNEKNFTYNSARDIDGHGTHTLSTAGGNYVVGANVFGYGNGTASGGSPKARVAAYKVCWDGCADADILAGFEHAISDGVDVLSLSLGGRKQEYFQSSISIGSFHAFAKNIFVVASAGNSGPGLYTVSNMEPWILTVAASTTDRDFASYVVLGNKKLFKGASVSDRFLSVGKSYPLISAVDAKVDDEIVASNDALLCKEGALDPHKAKGKILICLRGGGNSRVDKGVEASRVGAVGMILANNEDFGDEVIADPHVLPATHVTFTQGSEIFKYVNSTKSPVGYITRVKTQLGVRNSPSMAAFSSRGPNRLDTAILKPDITAPGVNIIAAYSEAVAPSEIESDKRRTPYLTMSGTSMSCPHVAGIVGLLKSIHPDWSIAAIKSAIMTTATTEDNIGEHLHDSAQEKATPLTYGAGHIRPNHAADPGLVYDLNITDYLDFLCHHGYDSEQLKIFYGKPHTCPTPQSFDLVYFNYPAIQVPYFDIGHSLNVTRTVTNVGSPSTYKIRIEAPSGLLVSVEPKILIFKEKGEKREYKVTLTLKQQSNETQFGFAKLVWTDGKHHVGTPIVLNSHE